MLRSIGILLLLFLTTFPISAQKPAFVSDECPFEPPDNVNVECGTVMLPENRAVPNGNQVRIAVAVFRAVGDDPLPDPVFYLDGGPGNYTLATWGPTFNLSFAPYNRRRDVVLFDYRGVGSSVPNLFCDEVQAYNMEALDQRPENYWEGYYAALEACYRQLTQEEKIDLSMYRSAILAHDVMDLREALGYEEINLLGGSYGSQLALTILRDQPEGIRSAILDGVVPLQVDPSAASMRNYTRVLQELFDACTSAPACDEAFPDLWYRFYTAVDQLNDKPATLEVNIPSLDDSYEVVVDGATFSSNIISAFYRTWVIPSLPIIIDQAAAGNYEQLRNIVSVTFDSGTTSSLGLRLTIECNDEAPFRDAENARAAAESSSDLVDILREEAFQVDFDSYDTCDYWGLELADPIENQPVYSEVPVALFNGQFDPVTPPSWGALAAETLPNSTNITFVGAGHGVSLSGSECVNDIALTFLDNPETPLDTSCAEEATIDWITVDLSDSLADIEAVMADADWTLDDQETSLSWNYGTWMHPLDYGVLRVIDRTTPLSESEALSNADSFLVLWDDYELIGECTLGELHLYEFRAEYDLLPEAHIRYWVDRRRPERTRQLFLAFSETSLSTLDTYSKQLFEGLPSCNS